MEEAEHHISLQDVKVPSDHRLPFQNLHDYLKRKYNKHVVKHQAFRWQSASSSPLYKHAFSLQMFVPHVELL